MLGGDKMMPVDLSVLTAPIATCGPLQVLLTACGAVVAWLVSLGRKPAICLLMAAAARCPPEIRLVVADTGRTDDAARTIFREYAEQPSGRPSFQNFEVEPTASLLASTASDGSYVALAGMTKSLHAARDA